MDELTRLSDVSDAGQFQRWVSIRRCVRQQDELDGSALIDSTYLGGSSDDVGRDIALDAHGDAYVIGYVES